VTQANFEGDTPIDLLLHLFEHAKVNEFILKIGKSAFNSRVFKQTLEAIHFEKKVSGKMSTKQRLGKMKMDQDEGEEEAGAVTEQYVQHEREQEERDTGHVKSLKTFNKTANVKVDKVHQKIVETDVKFSKAKVTQDSDEEGFVEVKKSHARKDMKSKDEEKEPQISRKEQQRQQRARETEALVNKYDRQEIKQRNDAIIERTIGQVRPKSA